MGTGIVKGFPTTEKLLGHQLVVTVPDLEAPLLLYVIASDHAVSGVLI